MKQLIFTILIAIFVVANVKSQRFNLDELNQIAITEFSNEYERLERINAFTKNQKEKQIIDLGNSKKAILYDVINNQPQYLTTYNLEARKTTGVEYIQSSNGLNLPLLGEGLTIGIWDGGLILNTHQEFDNRVLNKVGSQFSNHATHVAGTVGNSGVRPDAKGMLPKVNLLGFYAFENDLGPMAEEAARGLILSNHSYGLVLGWNYNSNTQRWQWYGQDNGQDNRFGSYTSNSRTIDNISYNAPNYLIVWSAGNDRSDVGDGTRPPDGPYNIIGPSAVSKNILTVGAITGFESYTGPSSAEMSSFSSWGPANDGRIKPDIVADGVGLLSSSSSGDANYTTLSGTSMAAPNATGTLGLLQDYYNSQNGQFMTSAMLKSLVIHTAREAGSHPGPDYRFGWGVLNAIDALKILQNVNSKDTLFSEYTLSDGEYISIPILAKKNSKITATIAWTDVPGTVTELGSTEPVLVNDLDLSIQDEDGNSFYPWVLNRETPSQAARKDVNNVDNIEKVELISENVNVYNVLIKHKGNLSSGSQKFGLTLTYEQLKLDNDTLLYWVNGDGSISNQNTNLSATSGGLQDENLQLSNKSLIIDNNSFDSDGLISLDKDVSIENLINNSDDNVTIDLSGNSLSLTNSLYTKTPNLTIKNGTLNIKAFNEDEIQLNFDGSENLIVNIDPHSTYEIISDVNIDVLNILSGTCTINNRLLKLNSFNTSSETLLEIKENIFEINSKVSIESEILNNERNYFQLENVELSNFPVEGKSNTTELSGENNILVVLNVSKLINNGKVVLESNFIVDTLVLNTNSELLLNPDFSSEINNKMIIEDSGNQIIKSNSQNILAELKYHHREKICLTNVNFQYVNFISNSVLNINGDTELIGNENIMNLNCEDVLFADFKMDSYCSSSLINFTNSSKGNYSELIWNFGDDEFNEGLHDADNPTYFFDNQGIYQISLTIFNDDQESTFEKEIEIKSNSLSEIKIIENNQGLVASVNGNYFEWYKDGILLEGQNSRILSFPLENGEYRVSYFNENNECKSRISEPYEVFVLSSDNEFTKNSFKVYPNPISSTFVVESSDQISTIRIFDLTGRVVFNKKQVEQNKFEINFHNKPNGIYIIEIQSLNKKETIKIFKK